MLDPWLDDESRAGAARLGYSPPRPPWPARSRPLRRSPGRVLSASSSQSIALCSRGPTSENGCRAERRTWTIAIGARSLQGVLTLVAYYAWNNARTRSYDSFSNNRSNKEIIYCRLFKSDHRKLLVFVFFSMLCFGITREELLRQNTLFT